MKWSNKGLAYRISGEGESSLLWIHGLCENADLWSESLRALPHFKHIVFELPGCGHSRSDGWNYDFSVRDIAYEIGTTLQKESISEINGIGHSMGGYVLLEMIDLFGAEFFKAVCLVNSTTEADSELKQKNRERGIRILLENRNLYMGEFFKNLYSARYHAQNPHAWKKDLADSQTIPTEIILHTMRALKHRRDLTRLFASFPHKKMFISGREDTVIPATDSIKQAELCGAGLYMFDHCGHVVPRENLADFVKALGHFVL